MKFGRFLFNFKIGTEAISNNIVRAILTSLGIIFGVAAVIAMFAIGKGAEHEILEQLKQVGSNNIVIKSRFEAEDGEKKDSKSSGDQQSTAQDGQKEKKRFSTGLTLEDGDNILATLNEHVEFVSPEIELDESIMRESKRLSGKMIGVNNHYFETANLSISEGKLFTDYDLQMAEPVCIIGKSIRSKLFTDIAPIGQKIKSGDIWLTVIGVLGEKTVTEGAEKKLSVRNANNEIYVPITTVLIRYKNRAKVTAAQMQRSMWDEEEADKKVNYNQLDRMVINVKKTEMLSKVSEIVEKMLKRRHNQVEDYEIIIPELLLKQEQKTKKLFNTVLIIIASISLVVGGIGIMNIMLASVMERIKEIGLRQSLGATRRDISLQFVSEAMTISISGGIIGILMGIIISFVIEKTTDIRTIISGTSIVVSFFISVAVGLFFGIAPALKASRQDPVESLRHE